MHTRYQIDAEQTSRDTDCSGCLKLWLSTFEGPWDLSLTCLIRGHWHTIDDLDFHRGLVTARRDDHELELLSLEAESTFGVLLGAENYWTHGSTAIWRRFAEVDAEACERFRERRRADPTFGYPDYAKAFIIAARRAR